MTLTKTPIRIYLDTSDYASFCSDSPSSEIQSIKDYLLKQADDGVIEVGFSWAIINELIQDFDEKHRQNRVKRAEVVKELCGTNAFCYPTELQEGRAFSRDGYWFPDIKKTFDIRAVEKAWIKAIAENKRLIPNRSQRNALKNPKLRRKALRKNPQLVDLSKADLGLLPLTEAFVNEQYLFRFMVGELSAEDANKELFKVVTDPVRYIASWFDMAGKTNTFTKQARASFLSLEEGLQKAVRALEEVKESIQNLKKLEREMYRLKAPTGAIRRHKDIRMRLSDRVNIDDVIRPSGKLLNALGPYGAEVFVEYFKERLDPHGMKAKSSDLVDIIHALYIPHCELWRGDSAFAHMLIKRSVNFSERVVPRLADLPARIDDFRQGRATL